MVALGYSRNKTSYDGGDTMIDFNNVCVSFGADKKVLDMFLNAMKSRKTKKLKEQKTCLADGSYCPKIKAGQSWAYTKDKIEHEEKEDS